VPKEIITFELYEAFQRVEIDRWDAIMAEDIVANSPANQGIQGREYLKAWAKQYAGELAYKVDLIDEHLALDENGNGRGFISFNLHWKHSKEFMGIPPSGREGNGIETLVLTIRDNKITKLDVSDGTLDLAIYLWERGWPMPHNVRPKPLREGVERR
jgi:predicted ester cyclase